MTRRAAKKSKKKNRKKAKIKKYSKKNTYGKGRKLIRNRTFGFLPMALGGKDIQEDESS